MATVITGEPGSPVSAYRPMVFEASRQDQTGAQVTEIRVADASDVSTLGAGLAVGDILVEHAAPLDGTPVPIAVGQTVLLSRCGDYSGIRKVTKVIDQDGTPSDFLVIEAPDYGTVTPTSPTGSIRVWLDQYAVVCELSVYTDPADDPQVVILTGEPDDDGDTKIDVAPHIRDFFTENIDPFCRAVGGGLIVQDAHGLTALFYRVRIAETYAVPDEDYPTDAFAGLPGSNIILDDFEDEGAPEWRVAVNAVHPYHRADSDGNELIGWSDEDLSLFQAGTDDGHYLSYVPGEMTMGETDRFRLHFLTHSEELVADPWTVAYELKLETLTASGGVLSSSLIPVELDDPTSAFSVAVGPADIDDITTLPDHYRVSLVAEPVSGPSRTSGTLTIHVDRTCKEVRRPICVLGLLGGVDQYTFTGREIVETKNGRAFVTLSSAPIQKDVRAWLAEGLTQRGKSETIQKPYNSGAGHDWTERAYKGPNAALRVNASRTARIIIESDSMTKNSGPYLRPLTIQYRIGADNLSQES